MEPNPRTRGALAMERIVGLTLLGGVTLSVQLLTMGLFWQWSSTGRPAFQHGLPRTLFARFVLEEMSSILRDGVSPSRLVNFGIIVLMLTPYVRVVLSMVGFLFAEKDYKYGVVTGFVGGVLTYSLFLQERRRSGRSGGGHPFRCDLAERQEDGGWIGKEILRAIGECSSDVDGDS